MLWIVIMVLLVLASAKRTHGPLGVGVKEAGKMKIGVDGTVLQISSKGECTNKFIIWYPVTQVTGVHFVKREGFCPCYPSVNGYLHCKPSCPLKLDAEGLMEIDVNEAPKGCTVTITNAYLALKGKSEGEGTWIIYVAILVPIGVLILLVLFGVVAWFCWRPRWKRARAARNAAAAQKNAVGAEVEEDAAAAPKPLTSVTSNIAVLSVPASTGMTPVATAVPAPVSSTAPSTVPPTTSTTPEAVKPSTPALPSTSSANPVMPPAPTPAKPVPMNPPKPTLQTYSTPVPIDQRPVHNIKKPVVVPPTSSGSSGRRRRKKLELSTEDFVEPDKVTGAPKPRKEPRKKRKPTTPEPALPPPPPLTDEEPPPTLLSEREQRKRGRAEAAVDVLKASAKTTAEDCCPDDSKRASTEATKAPAVKRPREKLVKFPLSDSRSQEKPEEVEEKARKASK